MDGFVLAGTESGVGKTVATLVTLQALEQAGYTVQPAKAGADFIDPSHHAAVAGKPSRTLDSWLEGEDGLRRNYHRGSGDICVVEGVMGMYDGDHSSTAAVAETLDVPVILVVDGSGGMESVAATAYGFQQYASQAGRDIEMIGVISQQTHGGRHERGIRNALPDSLQYFGRVPPMTDLSIPERHLGLHMGAEAPLEMATLDEAAQYIDADGIAETARTPPQPEANGSLQAETDDMPTIAVAHDSAFRFVYPAVRERLDTHADVVTFAPVDGDDLPDCDGVYLPGGYPELHGPELTRSPALETLSDRAVAGLPILGECGGLMALSDSLTTADGESYEMAGVLPAAVEMHDRYQALDHVELVARTETVTATTGDTYRGHEFHYSSASVPADASFAFTMQRGDGIDGEHDGLTEYATLGTYSHLHAESGAFDMFLDHATR
ncbi:cobyrinic acid a,c-diamide synthase [Halovenus rubra]|uniref:Cobyrinic acid a,c-diamide synthase n=2 Tax=Halovenus rubra TaxID=869890 RepID=A0ABD5XC21_9EURY|nr:cobyrinic acid a,c-diamide synthase [Halovenus rubra]